MKKRVLLVGESPYSPTGNAHMMRGVLNSIDTAQYDVATFCQNDVRMTGDMVFSKPPFNHIPAQSMNDPHGHQKLVDILSKTDIDILMMVGIDLWNYTQIYHVIKDAQRMRRFKWLWLFPFDQKRLSKTYVNWANNFDYPLVYSEYGYNMLNGHVKNIRYFRPPFFDSHLFHPYDEGRRQELRLKYLPGLKKTDFLFGFIGANQVRKDPLSLIAAFKEVQGTVPNVAMYMHTKFNFGVYNLNAYIDEIGITPQSIFKMPDNAEFPRNLLADFYNCFDCFVNCSLQEGLSWTVVEAMLCGTPVVASNNTSHVELLKHAGYPVPCNETSYLPIYGQNGEMIHVEADKCRPKDIAHGMLKMVLDDGYRESQKALSVLAGKEWVENPSDINDLFDEALTQKTVYAVPKKSRVLFCQFASAGDILMTTKCLEGLKKRHGLPLDYMTQRKFTDILVGNPNIDEIIEWDNEKAKEYAYVYNPHQERILPGHWGRNSNSLLSDFYWKLLDVKNGGFFIDRKRPDEKVAKLIEEITKPIVVIYTTGGDPLFRTYKFMGPVVIELESMGYQTVQLGGINDFDAGSGMSGIDLRGLSYREEAWVVERAKYGIAVDTFGAHLLGALGKSLIMLPGSSNHHVVRPDMCRGANSICLPPDYIKYCDGLGPCSGSVRSCPMPCMGRVSPDEIINAFYQLDEMEDFRL